MATGPIIFKPGLLQVRPQYDVDPNTGDVYENVLWFLSGSVATPTLANLTNMAVAFDAGWGPIFTAYAITAKHYNGSVWTDFSSNMGLSYSSVGTFTPVPGGVTGSQTPPQVAALISLHIAQRYRGGHGRIYLPYISGGAVTGSNADTIANAQVTAITTAFGNLNSHTTGSGVLSGQTQQVYRNRHNATTATLFPISSFTVQARLATQRRRLRKAPHK